MGKWPLDLTIDQVRLNIEDNGIGLAAASLDWVELTRQGHFGLVGMKERAEAVGGTLTISSKPGHGTMVRVVLPAQFNAGNTI